MRAFTISVFGFLVIAAISSCFCDGNSSVLCMESERQALLKFRQDLIDYSNRLSSWVEGEDCCKWNGVFCDDLTGHVKELHLGLPDENFDFFSDEFVAYIWSKLGGKINPSLLELKHLSFLDLSNNNFGGIQIPEFIGSLGSLTYLNLSRSGFQGAIPHKIGNLSKLQYLDLGYSNNQQPLETENLQWVSGLSSLKYLDLSTVYLATATDWLQVTSSLPSLVELHLFLCHLNTASFPSSPNFTSLVVLDLSGNEFSSVPTWIYGLHSLVSIDFTGNFFRGPIPDGFQNLSSLKVLDLSYNSINSLTSSSLSRLNNLQVLALRHNYIPGQIPSTIGNLTSLIHIDLAINQIQGIAPTLLENLCNLREMDLSDNEIDQEVSEILQGLSRCSLDKLVSLNMENNSLSGHLIDQLGQFKNLVSLLLWKNSISGPIPFSIGELSSLKSLDVSSNRLNGTLPQSIGQLMSLEILRLEDNLFEGVVSEMHFSNLTRLKILQASKNMLTFKPNPNWIPPFDCEIIELGYWNLGAQFPPWLQFQKNLVAIDTSHAGISNVIPSWFWNLSTQFLEVDLSHNRLVGEISYLFKSNVVDLSFNQFHGPLPQVFPNTKYLSLSENSFSGSLSHFLCNFSIESSFILEIKNNLLSGEIPDCWKYLTSIWVLNLGNNNLTGKIPRSLGSLNLYALNLRNNNLSGEVPATLQNCTSLSLLDLGENHLSGSIPVWLGNKLSRLVVLGLRSNNFHGHIPDQICALSSLQILDLGHNNISGGIPKCFSNSSAMVTKNPSSSFLIQYQFYDREFMESALLVRKGREFEYSTTLKFVTSIDLSSNVLTGEIPRELGSLKGLQSLNLSRNLLTGKIPANIGNMGLLESLDFSMNRLLGEIPPSFANLNFLSYLNLSYNNLIGQIPLSTQLQSFDEFSFIGNHLCGPPITKNCTKKGVTSGGSEGHVGPKVNGLYISIVLGFVMGFWSVVAPLFFMRSWRFSYYNKLEHIGWKIYEFWQRPRRKDCVDSRRLSVLHNKDWVLGLAMNF
ncbi:probable leucine-rich repeat receptor-like protein kinase At1g35710 [Durio zibethinus]|uniref:Probable leucine-rich repeat receptor-like protein kinase At1g35710 n=1 Tax=Durio zibethinus TaxID=66656 RepID=A0A6P5WVM1_DURZI|nr:probable leucine-rich repeat receptor-like protein kinase At1g35710 [Durio zibethinus]